MTRDSQTFTEKKKKKVIAGCCFLAVIFFITFLKGDVLFQEKAEIITEAESGELLSSSGGAVLSEKQEAERSVPQIVIDIAGAVSRPGILLLPEGSRVYEAVEKAGGLLTDSDLRDVNLAAELLDGEKLYIPCAKDYAEAEETEGEKTTSADRKGSGAPMPVGQGKGEKININAADSVELQKLKGVGPATAERILDYRRENGKFRSIEDLKNVKGIGEKTFEKLKDSISVT